MPEMTALEAMLVWLFQQRSHATKKKVHSMQTFKDMP